MLHFFFSISIVQKPTAPALDLVFEIYFWHFWHVSDLTEQRTSEMQNDHYAIEV